jgi:hypothetical protein
MDIIEQVAEIRAKKALVDGREEGRKEGEEKVCLYSSQGISLITKLSDWGSFFLLFELPFSHFPLLMVVYSYV